MPCCAVSKRGVVDVGSENLHFPWRWYEWLWRGHFEGQRITQVVVGQRVADENRERVGLLPCGAAGAPNPQRPIAALLLALQNFFEHDFLKEVELRADTKEARLIYGEILEQSCEFLLSLAAGEQPVVAVERVHLAGLEAALQAIAQKVRAAFVEIHAAFLIDQSLKELEFGICKWNFSGQCGHSLLVEIALLDRRLISCGATNGNRGRFGEFLEPPQLSSLQNLV